MAWDDMIVTSAISAVLVLASMGPVCVPQRGREQCSVVDVCSGCWCRHHVRTAAAAKPAAVDFMPCTPAGSPSVALRLSLAIIVISLLPSWTWRVVAFGMVNAAFTPAAWEAWKAQQERAKAKKLQPGYKKPWPVGGAPRLQHPLMWHAATGSQGAAAGVTHAGAPPAQV